MKKPGSMILLVVASVLFSGPIAIGQLRTGEIRLRVQDSTGAALEASGKMENPATGMERGFQTDALGLYNSGSLPYGTYRLEVSRDGFATQSVLIEVQSEAAISRTVTMALGAQAVRVEVVAPTPLPGGGLSRNNYFPAPVQAATQRTIEESGALDLSDFLNRRLDGVHVNEMQGNPFQPDVNYRGYTASPLLGTPQGLSVYMDGVRLNQPFGDVVSWDLIPRIAISETALMPGSNPLFGLNTLGGALGVQTKDGSSRPGSSVRISGGSFGRLAADLEHGGADARGLDWYLASSLFFEDGWRDDSPSNVRQFFGKLGWQHANTSFRLSAAYVNNSLTGNGVQEQRFLDRDYASVYTKPDTTRNRSPFFNLGARHNAGGTLTFSGNAYYRYIRTSTFNGDINENSLDQTLYQPGTAEQAALAAAGYSGFPATGAAANNTPFPFWRCIGNVLLNDEPAEKCNGLLNRTRTKQHNYGVSGQLTWLASQGNTHNQITAGAAYDRSRVGFLQSTELGYLNADRSVTGVHAYADGATGGNVDGVPFDARVDLDGLIQTASAFATDTISMGSVWGLTLSGRYNRTSIDNNDRVTPGGGAGSLDGNNVYDRLNPAAGVTFSPVRTLNTYVSYSEGSRAPTSIEIGCADPDQPCKLPNALAGDPPLRQVVARTWEAGIRRGEEGRLNWNLGWFRAENRNDILFVASTQTGFGYFKNFGKTRRQGLELNVNSRLRRVSLGGGYTFLDATYQSPETVNGSGNNTNDAGTLGIEGIIGIEPGNRIPLIPRHMMKAFAVIEAAPGLTVDLGAVAVSSSYARGNENNLHQADGVYYLGPGTSPRYAVFNFGARYQVRPRMQVFVDINNLFDRHYYTAAQLGPTGFTGQATFIARPFPAVAGEFPIQHATFYAPGAPRAAWGGLRFSF